MNNSGGRSTLIARYDYLPFGEEISSSIGLRTSGQGYGASDTNRQKFGLTERDDAVGLDHTWFRKYENLSGRWTSPDPVRGTIRNPQTFNRFSYTRNDPINSIDPLGLTDHSNFWIAGLSGWLTGHGFDASVNGWWNIGGVDHPFNDFQRSVRFSLQVRIDGNWYDNFDWLLNWGLLEQTRLPKSIIDRAKELMGRQPCGHLFKKTGVASAREKLQSLEASGGILVSKPDKAHFDGPKDYARVDEGKIYFNPNSNVMSLPDGGKTGKFTDFYPLNNLSKTDALAVTLIHELLHLTGDFPADPRTSQSESNTLNVRNQCLHETMKGIQQ